MSGLEIYIKVVPVYTALLPDLIEARRLQLERNSSVCFRVGVRVCCQHILEAIRCADTIHTAQSIEIDSVALVTHLLQCGFIFFSVKLIKVGLIVWIRPPDCWQQIKKWNLKKNPPLFAYSWQLGWGSLACVADVTSVLSDLVSWHRSRGRVNVDFWQKTLCWQLWCTESILCSTGTASSHCWQKGDIGGRRQQDWGRKEMSPESESYRRWRVCRQRIKTMCRCVHGGVPEV